MDHAFSAPSGMHGVIRPPADKSLTHRALMLASLSDGESRVANPLETGDCVSTRKILDVVERHLTEGAPLDLVLA